MPAGIRLRPRAQADLDDIWAHTVDTWSLAQAEAYLFGIGAIFDLLAEFPEIARLRAEFAPPVRIYPYREHLVIYLVDDDGLDVLRVVHRRQDWTIFFSD